MIIIVKTLLIGAGVAAMLQTMHKKHHSSVCHMCGGTGYVNHNCCPACCGDGKYHEGKDPHEHHYSFKEDDKAIDTEDDSCETDREFNA